MIITKSTIPSIHMPPAIKTNSSHNQQAPIFNQFTYSVIALQ